MKPKNWKNLWLYITFVSSCTIWCCTSTKVVKATNQSNLKKKGEPVSKISSLADSRIISESFDKSFSNRDRAKIKLQDKRETTANTSVISPPEIIHLQESTEKKTNIVTLQNKLSRSKILPIISKPTPDAIISEQSQNTFTTNQDLNLEFSDISIPNRELSAPIQITQNQEPSPPPPTPENIEENPPPPAPTPENIEKNPPPLESQPTDFPAPTPSEIEQKLDTFEDERSQRLGKLLELLEENKNKQEQSSTNGELGLIIAVEVPMEAPKPPEQKQPQPIEKPVANFKPIGYLLGRVGYFHTSNIFSSRTNPIDDGLIFTGLTLAAAPFKIAPKTYLNGSIDGNIIRYSDQSEFDYNQIRFNLGIYQQLTSKMYGEIGWNNQQLFYSKSSDRFNFSSGDKFLNENSFRLSVGRRDPLAPKLNLDSFYELRLSLTNPPEKRNRFINYVWFSLNYSLEESLRFGIDYQFNLANFLERSREDQYHRLSANLKYGISDLSSISLQSGFTLGGSTDRNIDFDGWFLSVNYSWDLGQF